MSSSIEEERKGPLSGHGHGRRRATLGLGREHSELGGLDREVAAVKRIPAVRLSH